MSATNTDTATAKPNLGAVTTASVLSFLMERAHLTKEELEWLAGGAEDRAFFMLGNLEDVADGIGCLVSNDGRNKSRAGSFQDSGDVPNLLFHLADVVGTARALLQVGSDAGSYLKHPESYRRAV